MGNELKDAIVRETKKKIQVYQRTEGGWVDFEDCNTVYKPDDLIILTKKK